ncbi:MAG: pilus assembly protein [Ruminococcaceae bacterium]|nr:pilus assembly protein [Oscillospiraceae bacterium]
MKIKDEKGAVQIVEISLVLPVAMIVVLTLIYLSFAMFIYSHTTNVARITINESRSLIGGAGLYWKIFGNFISDEDIDKTTEKLNKTVDKYSILPGMKIKGSFFVTSKFRQPTLNVNIKAFYFGKEIFDVTTSQIVTTPVEFAAIVDFGKMIEKDSGELKEIYDKFF